MDYQLIMKKYDFELDKLKAQNHDVPEIKSLVESLLKQFHLKGKFEEIDTTEAWQQLMGDNVANRTKKVFIQDKKMFIKLESASLKNELMMRKTQIIERLNEVTGKKIIEELIFM